MFYAPVGVWWDINTCPVPAGIDPRSVCSRITQAVIRRCGDRAVTIFCVGNLELIEPEVLKEICSSGIFLGHVPPFGSLAVGDHLQEWRKCYPHVTHILLISGDISWFTGTWFNSSILSLGYTILRAFPAPRPPGYLSCREWVWEALLRLEVQVKDYWDYSFLMVPGSVPETEIQRPPRCDPAPYCTLCEIPSPSCDDFISHLESSEHRLEFTNSVLAFVDENSYVVNHCKLFEYPGFNDLDKTIPWTGEDLSQNVSCLSDRAFNNRILINQNKGFNKTTTTGVWWDINTCPIPDGYDPGRVRWRIESALQEYLGPGCPVTIFGVGNLDFISPQVLKEISSSGILLRNSVNRGAGVNRLLREWRKHNPPPAKIMLISADVTWFSVTFFNHGYTILRAFPDPQSMPTCTYTHAWAWESLLTEKSCLVDRNSLMEENSSLLKDRNSHYAWCICTVCRIPSQSCDNFIKHLRSRSHSRELFMWTCADEKGIPLFFCKICKYPGFDDHNMKIHLTSEEHAQKVKEEYGVAKVKPKMRKTKREREREREKARAKRLRRLRAPWPMEEEKANILSY